MKSKKTDWIRCDVKMPHGNKLCDWLFTGDSLEEHVWMLCKADSYEAMSYLGRNAYWRPAEKLPTGVRRWTDRSPPPAVVLPQGGRENLQDVFFKTLESFGHSPFDGAERKK